MKTLFRCLFLIVTLVIYLMNTCSAQDTLGTQPVEQIKPQEEKKLYMIIKNDKSEYIGTIVYQNEKEVLIETTKIGRILIPRHQIREIKEIGNAGDSFDDTKQYLVIKNDHSEFVGNIIYQNEREVLIDTKKMGRVVIPKHEIKEIKTIEPKEIKSGEYVSPEVFATRYFISTNGLPIEQGDSYVLWSLYGPDFQFGVGKNFSVGVMTSWIALPIVGSTKISIPLSDKTHVAIGGLIGFGGWIRPSFGLAVPYGALTLGDRSKNITFSGGYGAVWDNKDESIKTENVLLSVAAMIKVDRKISLVFDSFIVKDRWMLFIPGIRLNNRNSAFQFGFAGLRDNRETIPLPIPFVQWYRKIGG